MNDIFLLQDTSIWFFLSVYTKEGTDIKKDKQVRIFYMPLDTTRTKDSNKGLKWAI